MVTKSRPSIRVNLLVDESVHPSLYNELLAVQKTKPRLKASRVMSLANVGILAEKGMIPGSVQMQLFDQGANSTRPAEMEVVPEMVHKISDSEANDLNAVFFGEATTS